MLSVPHSVSGLRIVDWASLNANLAWAYNGTNDVRGYDLQTQPSRIAIWLMHEGEVKVITETGEKCAKAGEWILPGRVPRRQIFSPDARVLSVNFDAMWPDGRWLFPGDTPEAFPAALNPRLVTESIRLVRYVVKHFDAKGVTLQMRTLGFEDFLDLEQRFLIWLRQLVQTAAAAGVKLGLPRCADERITEAIRLLNQWPAGQTFQEAIIARKTGLSPTHLNRLFIKNLGVSPTAYFERCRAKRACELLRDPDRSIKQVAVELGFSSAAYFSTWFQRIQHSSPKSYRRKNGRE